MVALQYKFYERESLDFKSTQHAEMIEDVCKLVKKFGKRDFERESRQKYQLEKKTGNAMRSRSIASILNRFFKKQVKVQFSTNAPVSNEEA